jgi:hypothetical protein
MPIRTPLLLLLLLCQTAVGQTPPPEAGRAAPAVVSKQDEDQIDAFFQAWLTAQNQGQFDKYQALYAEKFMGVRRSGPRVRHFDRTGWLKDRERMFSKPMTVSLADRKVTHAGAAFNVLCTQTWASGSYKDKGPKRFLLVRQAGRLVIAQEEMLASTVDRPPRARSGEYLLVHDGEPVVTDKADDTWADSGPLRLKGYTARSGVDIKALPDEIRRWRGKDLVLFDAKGTRCSAKVKGFAIVSGADWHFGTIQAWQEGNIKKQEMADQIWNEGAHRLVLTLDDVGKGCERTVLAVLASKAPAKAYPFVKLQGTPPEGPVLQATRKHLLKSVGGKTAELDGEEFQYVAFEDDAKTRGIAYSHHYPRECGEESGSANGSFLWRYDEKAKQRVSLLSSFESVEDVPSTPFLALDLDQDGVFEIVYEGAYGNVAGLLKKSGDDYEAILTVEVPFLDCGC